MLKRILKTGAGALCAVAILTSLANADVLNQRDDDNGVQTPIPIGPLNEFRTISISQNEMIQDLSITVEGLQHNFAGDLVAILRKVDPNSTTRASLAASNIFNRINGGLEDSNFGSSINPGQGANYTFTSTGGPAAISPSNIWTVGATLGPDDPIPSSTSGVEGNAIYSASNSNTVNNQVSLANAFSGQTTGGEWEFLIRDENNQGINGSFTGITLNFESTPISAIPEPGSVGLLAMASLGLCMRRRRK